MGRYDILPVSTLHPVLLFNQVNDNIAAFSLFPLFILSFWWLFQPMLATQTSTHTLTHSHKSLGYRLTMTRSPCMLHPSYPGCPCWPCCSLHCCSWKRHLALYGWYVIQHSDCILQWYSITQLVKWDKNKSKALPNSKIPEGTSTVFKWTAIYWDWAITSSCSGTRGVSAGINTLLFLLLLLEHQVPPSPPSSQTG